MAAQAVFSLNRAVDLAVPDVLGLWQAQPAEAVAGLESSGGLPPEAADEETTVWNVDLSGDPQQVSQRLDSDLARLDSVRILLPDASRKFDLLADRLITEGLPQFAAEELTVPEADALAWLSVAAQPELLQSGAEAGPEVAFLPGLPGKEDILKAAAQVAAFNNQTRQTLAQYALVQSIIDGRMTGATRVAWLGDYACGWVNDLSPEQADQHARAVRAAVATRRHWLRIAMLIAAGGIKVGAALGSGVGALIAATTAYRFIKLVVDEYQKMNADAKV